MKTVLCDDAETFQRMNLKELISCAYEGDLLLKAREFFDGPDFRVIGIKEVQGEETAIKCTSEENAARVAAQLEEAGIGHYWSKPGTHPGTPGTHWIEVSCAFPKYEET